MAAQAPYRGHSLVELIWQNVVCVTHQTTLDYHAQSVKLTIVMRHPPAFSPEAHDEHCTFNFECKGRTRIIALDDVKEGICWDRRSDDVTIAIICWPDPRHI